jgi:hypothetical protein
MHPGNPRPIRFIRVQNAFPALRRNNTAGAKESSAKATIRLCFFCLPPR